MLFQSYKHTPYQRRKNSWVGPKTLGIGLIILTIGTMLFLAASPPTRSSLTAQTRFLLYPSAAVQSVLNFGGQMVKEVKDRIQAKSELASVREELEKLRRENAELLYKLRDHDSYLDALHFPREETFPAIPAIVMNRDNRMTQSLIINRGAEDGLSVNMPVWSSRGLVGRTYQVYSRVSRVQPLTDPASAVGVYIDGTSYEGVLHGTEGQKQLLLTNLQLVGLGDETLIPKPGQAVYTSGIGMVFPRNLLAGTIIETTAPNGMTVAPAVDIKQVRAVLIITNPMLETDGLSLLTDK